ncbi:MAG TPA: hypothetical protein VIS06_12075 [Mycobacteriales bacterium]
MSETTTFYRVHVAGRNATGALAFTADNAFSATWGSDFVEGDPSRVKCQTCGGSGECALCYGTGEDCTCGSGGCRVCDGEGVEDLPRGYSCCDTAEDLRAYFAEHGTPASTDDVVVFEGRRVGTGFDGEPLAVPTGDARWMTWAEFTAQVSA